MRGCPYAGGVQVGVAAQTPKRARPADMHRRLTGALVGDERRGRAC